MEPRDAAGTGLAAPRAAKARSRWRTAVRAAALLAVAGLLALLLWKVVAGSPGSGLVSAVGSGAAPPAPRFDLRVIWPRAETWPEPLRRRIADGRVTPAELRGFPVVLNFWASWCGPCKEEAPLLAAAARRYAGRVAFLGVDVQDFVSDGRRFLRRYRANYVSVHDRGSTYGSYGLTGVPETYYLDRRGRIVEHTVGQLTRESLAAGVARIAAPERR